MSTVFKVGGARFQARPAGKPRTVHTSDRKLWWRGYEDGYYGKPAACHGDWYAHGHQEGSAAARRREEIRLRASREQTCQDNAPTLMRLLAKGWTA